MSDELANYDLGDWHACAYTSGEILLYNRRQEAQFWVKYPEICQLEKMLGEIVRDSRVQA